MVSLKEAKRVLVSSGVIRVRVSLEIIAVIAMLQRTLDAPIQERSLRLLRLRPKQLARLSLLLRPSRRRNRMPEGQKEKERVIRQERIRRRSSAGM